MTEASSPLRPEISLVIPVRDERENLPALVDALRALRASLGRRCEIVLVDDGSTDGSAQEMKRLLAGEKDALVVVLARNFGQTAALSAGVDHARGDVVVTLDADLQNDPKDVPLLLAEMERADLDVVSGWRRDRHDDWLTRVLPSRLANLLISAMTGVDLHDHGCTLKAYKRKLFDEFRLYGEMHRFIAAHASAIGGRVGEIVVTHRPRSAGTSKYGLGRTWKVLLDLVTVKFLMDYGTRPMYVFGSFGAASCGLGILSGAITLVQRALDPLAYVHRNPLILLAVFLFLLGMQSIMLGLLAEIGIRTYHAQRGGRTYVVRESFRGDGTG
jgi:glycosyltransferase involved in cell wall biosynthesis